MNANNRQQLLVIVAAVVVGLFFVDSFIVTPLTEGWKERSREIVGLKESIATGESLIDRETMTRNRWSAMQRNALPANASDAEEATLEAFNQWSKDTRVSISSIKPQWKRGENEDYSILECRVDASGDLASLTRFIYEVEKSTLALRVDAVEIAARDDEGRQLALGLLVSGLRLVPLEYN